MKALVWHAVNDVRIDSVPDPVIIDPTDVIIRVTATAICGSDLHLRDGLMPKMKEGGRLRWRSGDAGPVGQMAIQSAWLVGAVMHKGLTITSGQTHVQKYTGKLLGMIEDGKLDPSFVVTHRRPHADAPEMYKAFRE